MYTVRIDHHVSDFSTWKEAFDSDPVGRAAGGVRRHRVLQGRDDPNHVAIDLEFDDADQATAFLGRLHGLWQQVGDLVIGPRADVFVEVEARPE